jgi:hypothetical protein
VNIVDLINDTGRCLIGLSPADEIRIVAQARNLSADDTEKLQILVDESCKAILSRLDYFVDKTVADIREALEKK